MDSDFEKRLQRQPLRQIPGEWRADILDAARAAVASPHGSRITDRGFLSTISHQLSTLLWPHPKAWAGLAAAWLVIVAMNLYSSDPTTRTAKTEVAPSPELMLALREQRRELAKLIEPAATLDAEKPKSFLPSPRSEQRAGVLCV